MKTQLKYIQHWFWAAGYIIFVYSTVYYNHIMNTLSKLFGQDLLPNVMQNIGLGLISIFIPIAIFLFDRQDDQKFKRLDKSVALDFIIKAPSLLWKIALIFLPLLAWDVASVPVKAALFILWLAGISMVTEALTNAYIWIRKERFSFRFEYLTKISFNNELEELWNSVWSSVKINSQNEEVFFEIFSKHIVFLLDKKQLAGLNLLLKMLEDFQLFVSQRSYELLIWPKGVFERCLAWHFDAWKRSYSELDPKSDSLELWANYDQILSTINTIVYDITKRALEGSRNSSLFISIHKHASRFKNLVIKGHTYPETLVQTFFHTLLVVSETSRNNYSTWKNFPPDWLITNENLNLDQKPILKVIFDTYRDWLQNRLMSQESGKLDFVLEDVSKTLFPNAHPFFMATIMTLCHRTWYDSRMRSLVEIDRSFGLFGRISVGVGNPKEIDKNRIDMRNAELNSTAELILRLLPLEFTERRLRNYISELESFEYDKTDHREHYRNEILNYLNKLLETLLANPQIIKDAL